MIILFQNMSIPLHSIRFGYYVQSFFQVLQIISSSLLLFSIINSTYCSCRCFFRSFQNRHLILLQIPCLAPVHRRPYTTPINLSFHFQRKFSFLMYFIHPILVLAVTAALLLPLVFNLFPKYQKLFTSSTRSYDVNSSAGLTIPFAAATHLSQIKLLAGVEVTLFISIHLPFAAFCTQH